MRNFNINFVLMMLLFISCKPTTILYVREGTAEVIVCQQDKYIRVPFSGPVTSYYGTVAKTGETFSGVNTYTGKSRLEKGIDYIEADSIDYYNYFNGQIKKGEIIGFAKKTDSAYVYLVHVRKDIYSKKPQTFCEIITNNCRCEERVLPR